MTVGAVDVLETVEVCRSVVVVVVVYEAVVVGLTVVAVTVTVNEGTVVFTVWV